MATRFYFRADTASSPPSDGEKSTVLPVGTFTGNSGSGFENLSLSTTKGSSQTSKAIASLAQTAHQDEYLARFTSAALAAQTIDANTWTVFGKIEESNANANTFALRCVYVWRPGTSSVVGFLIDSDTPAGSEWPTTATAGANTFSGSAVTAQDGDVLVYEFWLHAEQAKANSYTNTFYFDGTDETTVGTGNTSCASYMETPQNLTFYTPATTGLGWYGPGGWF